MCYFDLCVSVLVICAAQNNSYTRHLAKILIHRSLCLQEYCILTSDASNDVYDKAANAVYISSVFLKYLIENAKDDNLEELYLSLDENEPIPKDLVQGNCFVIRYYILFMNFINVCS